LPFKCDLQRYNEADRLLDLGFEEDLNAILADITRRTVGLYTLNAVDR
jgi:ATP-dependent RNA helicase DDX31/DBP7